LALQEDFGEAVDDPTANISFFDLVQSNELSKPLQAKAFYQVHFHSPTTAAYTRVLFSSPPLGKMWQELSEVCG
jgi:hypothetical protein